MVGVENARGVVGVELALGLSKIRSLASNFPMHRGTGDRQPLSACGALGSHLLRPPPPKVLANFARENCGWQMTTAKMF